MVRLVILFTVCAAVSFNLAQAVTPEQKAKINEQFEKSGLECVKDNAITEDDIVNLKTKKLPTSAAAPCFLACFLRNIGAMDAQGKLQREGVLETAKTIFNEEELKTLEEYLHSCAHINDEPVGDGEKGCERALSAYKCMAENAPKFNFDF